MPDGRKHNRNIPTGNENNYRIRTVTASLGRGEGDDVFEPSRMAAHEVTEYFGTDILTGLDERTAAVLRRHGVNELYPTMKLSFFRSLRTQAAGMTGLLLAAMCLVLNAFSPDRAYIFTAWAVPFVMVFNAFLEHSAAKGLEEVKKHASLRATVLRGGKVRSIDSRALVPGDVIMLERGSIVPADARLIESNKLGVLETPLTGRTDPAFKSSVYINRGRESRISRNMVYGGSIIASGSGVAIVTATGEELRIRKSGKKQRENRPQLLDYSLVAANRMTLCSIAFCFVITFASALRGVDIATSFLLSLCVGFIAFSDTVCTLSTLSLVGGVRSLLNEGAAVRNLNSIRPLCEVDTVMCGSENAFPVRRMRVENVFTGFRRFSPTAENSDKVLRALVFALACYDVKLEHVAGSSGKVRFSGTKSAVAVARACRSLGVTPDDVSDSFYRIETRISSDNERARVLVIHEGEKYVIERGDPADIIARCTRYEQSGTTFPLVGNAAVRFRDEEEELADKSQHVIAVAYKQVDSDTLEALDTFEGMTFIALIGLYTSIEMNAASAVYSCRSAGITPVVKSDAPYATAVALAKDAGIIVSEDEVITGPQIEQEEYGLYVVDSHRLKLYVGITREQWEQAQSIRTAAGAKIAYEAQTLDELEQMASATVSLVPADAGNDTLRQCADVVLYRDGLNVITALLTKARLISLRIHGMVEHSLVACTAFAVALSVSILAGISPPFGLRQLLLCGGINLIALIFTALTPVRRGLLGRKLPDYGRLPRIRDFAVPVAYGLCAGAAMLTCTFLGDTPSVVRSMAFASTALSLVLYPFAGNGKDGTVSISFLNALAVAVCAAAVGMTLYRPTVAAALEFSPLGFKQLFFAAVLALMQLALVRGARSALNAFMKLRDGERHKRLFESGEENSAGPEETAKAAGDHNTDAYAPNDGRTDDENDGG